MSLENKVAVVNGAGTGIGQGIALAMAKAGASIVVDYVGKASTAHDMIDQFTQSGGEVVGEDADISSPEDVHALVQRTVQAFGTLDIFVNNAGIEKKLAFVNYPLDEWQKILDVNLTGPFCAPKPQLSR